jgi:hypothetical protein
MKSVSQNGRVTSADFPGIAPAGANCAIDAVFLRSSGI